MDVQLLAFGATVVEELLWRARMQRRYRRSAQKRMQEVLREDPDTIAQAASGDPVVRIVNMGLVPPRGSRRISRLR